MKTKVTKQELRECVSNAVTRFVNEKFDDNRKLSKHEQSKKKAMSTKQKGGGGSKNRWADTDDEDMY